MKLYPALKDPEMKYPRLANALLDVGMLLNILSSAGLIFGTVFYSGEGPYMQACFIAWIAGAVLVAGAARVSKARRAPTIDAQRQVLHRVK